jgi:hypothetical protein
VAQEERALKLPGGIRGKNGPFFLPFGWDLGQHRYRAKERDRKAMSLIGLSLRQIPALR